MDLKERTSQPGRNDGYVYRRPVGVRELVPAIGAGIVTGLAVFYVVRLFLERAPLASERRSRGTPRANTRAT